MEALLICMRSLFPFAEYVALYESYHLDVAQRSSLALYLRLDRDRVLQVLSRGVFIQPFSMDHSLRTISALWSSGRIRESAQCLL